MAVNRNLFHAASRVSGNNNSCKCNVKNAGIVFFNLAVNAALATIATSVIAGFVKNKEFLAKNIFNPVIFGCVIGTIAAVGLFFLLINAASKFFNKSDATKDFDLDKVKEISYNALADTSSIFFADPLTALVCATANILDNRYACRS